MTIVVGIIGDVALIGIVVLLWQTFKTIKSIESKYSYIHRIMHDTYSILTDIDFDIKYPAHGSKPKDDEHEEDKEDNEDVEVSND